MIAPAFMFVGNIEPQVTITVKALIPVARRSL
jgi:hypothetical protein